MTNMQHLSAMAEIREIKAKYWRGVDMSDGALVRSILAEDCVLDYMGCCTDPVSGVDHMPEMNMILRGRDAWPMGEITEPRAVTVHQGHQCEIKIASDFTATAIWAFTDRFFMPPGARFSRLTGYGHYHDTYRKHGGRWLLKTTRITRLWVETT